MLQVVFGTKCELEGGGTLMVYHTAQEWGEFISANGEQDFDVANPPEVLCFAFNERGRCPLPAHINQLQVCSRD